MLLRLDKFLSNSGLGTRSEIKKYIKYGNVKVNGEVVKSSSKKVNDEKDIIELFGKKVEYKKYIYLIMNKPSGIISSTEDKKHKTVIDILDKYHKNFKPFPVGRLDIDTEGLLILTNDGEFAHNMLSPKKHVDKLYYAIIDGIVDNEDIEKFRRGININDEYTTKKAILEIKNINKDENISEVLVTIREGKFHQIKRMFKSLGKEVKYLKRLKMGEFTLPNDLSLGEYIEIDINM